jgi:ketosteroid isomerase-like protein
VSLRPTLRCGRVAGRLPTLALSAFRSDRAFRLAASVRHVTAGENASIVSRLLEAYLEGRKDEAVQLLAEDVVFYADPSWPEVGSLRGPRTVLAQFDQWDEVFGSDWRRSITIELEELPDGRVLVENKLAASGAASGVPFEQEFASIYTIRDGLVAEAHLFLSWARAREAARLPPS